MYNYNSLFLFHLVTCIPVNRNNESTWEGCVVLSAVGGYPVGVAIAHKRKMLNLVEYDLYNSQRFQQGVRPLLLNLVSFPQKDSE